MHRVICVERKVVEVNRMSSVRVTPEEYQEKHARRLKAAIEDMRKGVDRVSEAPGKAAAAKQSKMRERIVAAIDSGKWAKRVASVSLDEWKSAMKEKGLNRVAGGIDRAAPKVKAFAAELIAYENEGLKKLDTMPDVTLEDSINRATFWIRHMSKWIRK